MKPVKTMEPMTEREQQMANVFFGHAGRPGQVGGSMPKGEFGTAKYEHFDEGVSDQPPDMSQGVLEERSHTKSLIGEPPKQTWKQETIDLGKDDPRENFDVPDEMRQSIIEDFKRLPPLNSDDDAEVDRYIKAVEDMPGMQRIDAALKSYADRAKCPIKFYSKVVNTDVNGNYTPERQALHEKFIQAKLNPNAAAPKGTAPKLVFLLGAPGSGKGTSGKPIAEKIAGEHTYVNADDAKQSLPGYRGWNAGLFQEESSDMTEKDLMYEAGKRRHNMIFDATGGNAEKIRGMIDSYSKLGYECHVVNVQVQRKTSIERAVGRFGRGTAKAPPGHTGRFVPPGYVKTQWGKSPISTYRISDHPNVKSMWLVDNDTKPVIQRLK